MSERLQLSYIDRPSIAEDPERYGHPDLPGTAALLASLDEWVQKRMLITLTGPSGSGKCRMLDEWARGRAKAARPDQIVMIRAIKSGKERPMACVIFPRIWHEIQQVGRPAYQRHDDEGEPITMYNARQIESLRQRIIEEVNKRDVRAIVVARANLLDDEALEWLLDLRSYRSREIGFAPRFALVLACTSSSDGSSPKIIHSLRKMHEIAAEWRQLKLGLIDEREAGTIIPHLIYLNLYAQFEPSLDRGVIGAKLFDLTGGSWWLLRQLALYIDEKLGLAQSKERRQVTMDVLDRVYKRFEDNR